SFAGNLLFVFPPDGEMSDAAESWTGQQPLSADDTRPLPYVVQRFDANHLVVSVTNTAGDGTWMSYADVWHPSSRATGNGKPVQIYRAQMAYKAVPLDRGENVVSFEFDSSRFDVLAALFAANAAMWIAIVLAFVVTWRGPLRSAGESRA